MPFNFVSTVQYAASFRNWNSSNTRFCTFDNIAKLREGGRNFPVNISKQSSALPTHVSDFRSCCSVSKPECSRSDSGRTSMPNLALVDLPQANSAFHPSGVGKWVPALAGKAKAGMVHSVSGWTRSVQVKLWDPLRTRAIPERLRGVFTTRRYINTRLPLPPCKMSWVKFCARPSVPPLMYFWRDRLGVVVVVVVVVV